MVVAAAEGVEGAGVVVRQAAIWVVVVVAMAVPQQMNRYS